MAEADTINAVKRYLRRTYAADLAGLKTLADTVAAEACEAVTITGTAYEGGSGSGAITFSPGSYLAAIESVIADLDPDAVTHPADSTTGYLRFIAPGATYPFPPANC